MQVEHQVNALHTSLAVGIEEEDTCVVDKDIHHEVVVQAVLMQLLGSILFAQVSVQRNSLYAILRSQVGGYLVEFFLLIAN